jgi:hypothetical protein
VAKNDVPFAALCQFFGGMYMYQIRCFVVGFIDFPKGSSWKIFGGINCEYHESIFLGILTRGARG